MNNAEQINKRGFFYKVGVMSGDILLTTYRFNDFEKMMKELSDIDDKYKSDMQRCAFVIQAFKDSSYDFKNSCFCQMYINVMGIKEKKDTVASRILHEFEERYREND